MPSLILSSLVSRGHTPHTTGYSGVVALVKEGVEVLATEIDTVGTLNEGRTVTLELGDVWLVLAYVPNSNKTEPLFSLRPTR